MALRRTTATASTLLAKFLNAGTPSIMIAPLASCSFTTSAKDDSPGIVLYSPTLIVQGAPQVFKMENPFQSVGPGNAVEVNEVKNGTLVRLVLPGVGENGIKVWTENNTVFFAGEGEIEWEGDDCRRKYGGSLEFHPEEYRADGVKAEMKNGILRLLVPNAEAKEKKEGK